MMEIEKKFIGIKLFGFLEKNRFLCDPRDDYKQTNNKRRKKERNENFLRFSFILLINRHFR